MRKNHVRDYATDAFRFYAKTGGTKKYTKKILDDMQKSEGQVNGISNPTEAEIVAKEKMIQKHAAELSDLEAVERVLGMLSKVYEGKQILKAIELVYFKDCRKPIKKGDIQARVHYAEIQLPASERQIYRWLKQARDLFAVERGLRL